MIKQIVQPLVENSILHGFKDLTRQGKIYIRCYKVGQEIQIDIIDNGRGFPNRSNGKKTGYAMSNLEERMRIVFGDTFGLERLASEQGAWIRLKLPILSSHDINDTRIR